MPLDPRDLGDESAQIEEPKDLILRFDARVSAVDVPHDLLRQLWCWAIAAGHGEISAIGEAVVQNTTLKVLGADQMHLLDQKGSPVATHLSMEAWGALQTDMIQQGRLDMSVLRFWWHLHPGGMFAEFSYTDKDTINQLSKLNPIILAAVFNARGESQWCLAIQNGMKSVWSYKVPGPTPHGEEVDKWKPILETKVSNLSGSWSWGGIGEFFGFSGYEPNKEKEGRKKHHHKGGGTPKIPKFFGIVSTTDPTKCRYQPGHAGCNTHGHELDRKIVGNEEYEKAREEIATRLIKQDEERRKGRK